MIIAMKIKLLFAFFIVWFLFIREDVVEHGAGVVAPQIPVQEKITLPKSFSFKSYTITPLAKFHLQARVLSKEKYRLDHGAKLSPVDLALGWGRMSDEEVLKEIDISQSGRWYHWQTDRFPIPRREIEIHSANMHMIPANEEVEDALKSVRKGEIVKLDGYLIRSDGQDGSVWVSSLSRADSGAHACELFFVETFEIIEPT